MNMNIKDYKFNVGDEVINIYGVKGKIIDICTCEKCEERGFYEPLWHANNEYFDDTDYYITNYDAECGFQDYYKIGNYMFDHKFDRDGLMDAIKRQEEVLHRFNEQLKTIDSILEERDGHY